MTKQVKPDNRLHSLRQAGKRLLVCALVAAMIATAAGCNSVANSRANAVVAEVNDVKIYRWELDRLYEQNREVFEANSGIEGLNLESAKYSEQRLQFRRDLLQSLIDDVIATESAKADGYALSDEEKTEVDANYQQWKQNNIQIIRSQKYAKDDDGLDKAEADWLQQLADNHLTEEFLLESRYNDAVREKLSADLFSDISISDEELKRAYDQKVAEEEEKYNEKPETYAKQYARDAFAPNNQTIVYNPPGFIRVIDILIALPEDIDQELKDLTTKQYDMILKQNDLAAEKGSGDAQVKGMQKELEELKITEAELYEKGYAQIQARVDEVYAKVQAGEDFHKLIEEYGEDPGMVYPFNEYGYLVGAESSHLVKGLRDAALSLKEVGDISEPTRSINGIHIVKMVSKVEPGPVSFEESKGFFEELAVGDPMITTLDDYVTEKTKGFAIKIHDENL